MTGHVVVGVDTGGTKTRLAVADLVTGSVLDDRTVPSTGWQTRSPRGAAQWLGPRILDSLAAVGPAPAAALAVGAHGCETSEQCDRLSGAVRALLGIPVTVVNDAELLIPAAGLEHGIGVVAGTGSIAVGRHRETGAYLKAGGWGWVLGDEGSGSALVREAARAVLDAADADRPADVLQEALLSSFGQPGLDELAAAMSWDGGVETWGAHAPAVFDAADAGSPLAAAVVSAGGRALAGLVARLVARGARTDAVVAAGGAIASRRPLYAAFEAGLTEVLPGVAPVLLDKAPVHGALALALRGGR
jgi:N-acetylglucosamine kinase-like BadF-type ATPase